MNQYVLLMLKGMAMGMADLVPGVSGGTVAMLTGIYERLIDAIGRVRLGLIKVLRNEGVPGLWRAVDASFLLPVLSGAVASILLFAHLVSWWMTTFPVIFWAVFFGLVLASVFLVGKRFAWGRTEMLAFTPGVLLVASLAGNMPALAEPSLPMYFGAGAVAICAMILPGISGSLLLLTLGMYQPVMLSVKQLDIPVLTVFALGCATGLLLGARVIRWALVHSYRPVMAFLTGLMAGSLFRVWPWQSQTGGQQSLLWPWEYMAETGEPALTGVALLLMILAMCLILGVHYRFEQKQN
jgi:putative membrane protein